MDHLNEPILPPRKTRAGPVVIGTLVGAFIAAGGTYFATRGHGANNDLLNRDAQINTLKSDIETEKANGVTLYQKLVAANTQICRHGIREFVVHEQPRLIGHKFNVHAEQTRENGDVVCQGQVVAPAGHVKQKGRGRIDPTVPFTFTISPKNDPILVCSCLRNSL